MKNSSVLTGLAVALVCLAAIDAQQQPSSRTTIRPEPLAGPAGANTTEPQITATGDRVILSWLELADERASLKFSEWTSSGWAPARTAASGDDFMINDADVPTVRSLSNRSLVAEWLQQDGPNPESYKVRLSWSRDSGASWSAPISPHHDKVQTQHGFASLFELGARGLGLVWLDGRAIPADAPEGVGSMALRTATFGDDGHFIGESVIDGRVCECCSTAVAETTEGPIVAYRRRSAAEVRDIYVTRLANGRWTQPVAVHHDGWIIKGCPVNGPAISAQGRNVVVAWFTAKGGTGHAFLAFSGDGGRIFGSPVRLDDATSLGRVGVTLLDDGSAVATWVEAAAANKPATFMARRISAHGEGGKSVRIADAGGTRSPRVGRSGSQLLFAWTDTRNGPPQVYTARATID